MPLYRVFHSAGPPSTLRSGDRSYGLLRGPREGRYMDLWSWAWGEPRGRRGRLLPKKLSTERVCGASLKGALKESDLLTKDGDSRS